MASAQVRGVIGVFSHIMRVGELGFLTSRCSICVFDGQACEPVFGLAERPACVDGVNVLISLYFLNPVRPARFSAVLRSVMD